LKLTDLVPPGFAIVAATERETVSGDFEDLLPHLTPDTILDVQYIIIDFNLPRLSVPYTARKLPDFASMKPGPDYAAG
jgi:hypothetical protein